MIFKLRMWLHMKKVFVGELNASIKLLYLSSLSNTLDVVFTNQINFSLKQTSS